MSTVKERALNYMKSLPFCGEGHSVHEVMTNFALLERDSAMKEAAGLVCEVCRDKEIHGLPVTKLERNNSGQWWHRTSRQDISLPCHAWPIHERLAQKGGTE